MDRITTVIDGNSSKEFVKSIYVLDYIALGVGALCVLLYLIFSIANHDWLIGLNLLTLSIGLLLIILAIVLIVKLNGAIKKADEFKRTITYEFESEHLLYEVTRNEEIIESGKFPYADLTGYKETKNYVYVGLKNNTWFAMKKVDGLMAYLESKGLARLNKKR